MKILLLIAKGFETMEFSVFVDIFGWARNDYGVDIKVETCGFSKKVTSTFGIPVTVDKTVDEIAIDDYDALAIPGGFEEFGFYEDAYDAIFSEIIKDFDSKQKPIASICVGALALGKSGVLTGRNATTYHFGDGRRQKQLSEFGVNVINNPIVVDKNIITSYCPQTAPGVAFELLKILSSEKIMNEVKYAMGY